MTNIGSTLVLATSLRLTGGVHDSVRTQARLGAALGDWPLTVARGSDRSVRAATPRTTGR